MLGPNRSKTTNKLEPLRNLFACKIISGEGSRFLPTSFGHIDLGRKRTFANSLRTMKPTQFRKFCWFSVLAHLLDQCDLRPEPGFAYHEFLPALVLLDLQAPTAYQIAGSALCS